MTTTITRKSHSPLRNKENWSPRVASPGYAQPPYVPIDDPVERRSLIAQLDELKQRLHYDYTKDNDEIQNVKQENDHEIHTILTKKDALVEESHMRIHSLKREIEEEENKAERIRQENVRF